MINFTLHEDLSIPVDEDIFSNFYLKDFRNKLYLGSKSNRTIEYYVLHLIQFIRFTKKPSENNITNKQTDNNDPVEFKTIHDLKNRRKLESWFKIIKDLKIEDSTYNKYRKALIKFCDFIKDRGLVDWEENPVRKHIEYIDEKERYKKIEILSDNERILLIKHLKNYPSPYLIKERNLMLTQTVLNSGLRRAELANLKKEYVLPWKIEVKKGKWNKDRTVYISDSFYEDLKQWCDFQNKNEKYVFCERTGEKLDNTSITTIYKRLKKTSWIKVNCHKLRHTYATEAVKSWVNLITLKELLWHDSIKTTERYIHLVEEIHKREVQKIKYNPI